MREMLVKLEEITKCPVCLESVGTSVVQCLAGHGICNCCRLQLSRCPLCKDAFALQNTTLLTQILEQLPKICVNNNRGCQEISITRDHEVFCEYRLIKCKIGMLGECKWLGLVKDFKSHVQSNHYCFYETYPCGQSKKLYFKNFRDSWHTRHYLHVVENHMFLLFVHKDQTSKRFFQVVKQIPLGQINQVYYFKVTLGEQHFVFKNTIKACFSIDENEQLKSSPHCMIVPIKEVDSFLIPNTGSLEVTYVAFKMKESF